MSGPMAFVECFRGPCPRRRRPSRRAKLGVFVSLPTAPQAQPKGQISRRPRPVPTRPGLGHLVVGIYEISHSRTPLGSGMENLAVGSYENGVVRNYDVLVNSDSESCGLACHVMSCHVMLCYVMLCYVILCYVMLWCVMLCYVLFCYVLSCHVVSCHVMSCHVVSCRGMLCHVRICYVMSCYVM